VNAKPSFPRLEDDEVVDEVRLVKRYRYKTSELSGDEWRTSVVVVLLRKGEVVYEGRAYRDFSAAISMLGAAWIEIFEQHINCAELEKRDRGKCMQPGCAEEASSDYRLKQRWCSRCGQAEETDGEELRRFCRQHLRRGDASLEDADKNYEVVSGPGPGQATGWEPCESEAVFGGVIELPAGTQTEEGDARP